MTFRIRRLWLLLCGAVLTGCLPEPVAPSLVPPFVVSSASTVPAVPPYARAGAAGPQSATSIVWVSLPQGSIPRANAATIRDPHSGARVIVLVTDGGFDPVAVAAGTGDTLFITVQGSTKVDSTTYSLLVPSTSLPRIVRSVPPPNKRDVPLNVTIVVTFSEPMDSGSLVHAMALNGPKGSITGSVSIPPQDSGILRAEFVPAAPLAPSQTYTIEVGASAHTSGGAGLASAYSSDFTASDTAPPAVAPFHLTVHLDSRLAQNPMIPATGTIPGVIVTYQGCASGCPTTYTGDVTLALGAHPNDGVLSGITTAHMVNGVATFPDLWVDWSGIYSLVATAPGSAADTSSAFEACTNDCWERRTPMPQRRNAVGVVVVGGALYAIGGVDSTMTPTGFVEAYDPTTDHWTEKAWLPVPRYGSAMGVVNGIIYVAGGMTASGPTETVEAYNPATDSWSSRSSLPTPTAFPAGAVFGGKLYAVGGELADSAMITTALAYDPTADQWSAKAPLPAARSAAALGVADTQLFVFGGRGFDKKTVFAYNPSADQWTSRTPGSRGTTRGWYWGPFLLTTAMHPDLGLLVMSGSDSTIGYLEDPYAVGYAYDPAGDQFTTTLWMPVGSVPPGYPPHESMLSAGFVNGELFMVGYETWRFIPYGAPSPYAPPFGTSRHPVGH